MAKKILLADDSITIQKVVELTFSDGDYEVVATNNGTKAIQKLAELRPDIILSDIIMPEKNGYELCEYVKSHPDFRHIPVVLLTGTFEPFDPDRAEKAGCDAVITKPFESQSLIHKVEELIEQSAGARAAAGTTATAPIAAISAAPESRVGGAPAADTSTAKTTAPSTPTSPPPPIKASSAFEEHEAFAGSKPSGPSAFEEAPLADEPRAMPKMSFEDLQQQQSSAFSESPEAESGYSGATKAFPKMSFEDLKQMSAPEPEPPSIEGAPMETGWSPPEEAAPASEWATTDSEAAGSPFRSAGFGAASPPSGRESLFETNEPETPSWTSPPAIPEPGAWPASPPPTPSSSEARTAETPAGPAGQTSGKLSDEEVDRIARRVIELMSDSVVKNIAWEVIPDLAEMVVRERIRQLESES
jgi:CheY-like chemotaxis protein